MLGTEPDNQTARGPFPVTTEFHDERSPLIDGGPPSALAAALPSRCLVTGAGGFIGSRLFERWASAGSAGRGVALVRRPDTGAALGAQGAQVAVADLLDPGPLAAALQGCDAVVHLAFGDRAPQATRNLLAAAARAGVHRMIHISTMSVHGPAPGPDAAHEETATIGRYGNDYSDSKAEQEEIVQAAHDRGDISATILRPTVVYGPGSFFVTQVVDQARRGSVSWFDEGVGLCNAVYVDDVCDAIDAALSRPEAAGQAYFINGDRAVTWRDFITAFAQGPKLTPRFTSISSAEAIAYWAAHPPAPAPSLPGRVVRKVLRLLGKTPPPAPFPFLGRVQRETIRITFSNEKARRLLGWSPRVDFDEGVRRTQDWLQAGGHPG